MYIRADWRKRIILGAAGGFVGTLAIQALLTASQKWLPHTVPPLRQEAGEFMVKTGVEALPDAVCWRIPQVVETAAARMLAVGYVLTFGILYALLRPKGGLSTCAWHHPWEGQLGYWVSGGATGLRADASYLEAESPSGHCSHCRAYTVRDGHGGCI
jgi:hypothetical protein